MLAINGTGPKHGQQSVPPDPPPGRCALRGSTEPTLVQRPLEMTAPSSVSRLRQVWRPLALRRPSGGVAMTCCNPSIGCCPTRGALWPRPSDSAPPDPREDRHHELLQ